MLYKIISYLLICWLILCFLLGKYEMSVDGYNEIGLPFLFYRNCSAKGFHGTSIGFLWEGFIGDILLVLVVSIILKLVITKNKTVK